MLRIKPLSEEQAVDYTKSVYEVIKPGLQVHSIPLYFQYIGNFPEYLGYLWNMIAPNLQTSGMTACTSQLNQIASSAIEVIYHPSETAQSFGSQIHPSEKDHIRQTIADLRALNLNMMIITIAIRESMKGVFVAAKQLPQSAPTYTAAVEQEKTLDEIVQESLLSVTSSTTSVQQMDARAANMLVPIYGANSLMISQYPAFFGLAAAELETLMTTEAYLKARVEMEKITHILLMQLPSPIHISYVETSRMLFDKPNANDLLFLIKDTFPALFPKLVLATELMGKILKD